MVAPKRRSRREALALRTVAVTRADAVSTLRETYPLDAVRLVYGIDVRSLELLAVLKDRLPPDSPTWPDLEQLERSIDSGLTTAIPIEPAEPSLIESANATRRPEEDRLDPPHDR